MSKYLTWTVGSDLKALTWAAQGFNMSCCFFVLVSYYSHIEKKSVYPSPLALTKLTVYTVSEVHSLVHLGFSSPVLISHRGWMLFGSAMSFIKAESLSSLDSPEDGSLPLVPWASDHSQGILFVRDIYTLTEKGHSDTLQFVPFFWLHVLFLYIDIYVCIRVKCAGDRFPDATSGFRNCRLNCYQTTIFKV